MVPLVDLPELHDPAITGEWAPAFAKFAIDAQIPPWCSYLARRDDQFVATGGFNGPPDKDHWAEIAYITFLPWRSQGVATAVAARLMQIAKAEGLKGVFAHTLPEENASTRVLVANGFTFVGEGSDPDEGSVWRWERAFL
ncbi:MAG: GNAT family N-acetyltransferase [Sphingomicrobium sp.]